MSEGQAPRGGDPSDAVLVGRLALHYKLITMDQLSLAIREHGGSPHARLGDLLVVKGWITPKHLQQLLEAQRIMLEKRNAAKAPTSAPGADSPARAHEDPPRSPAPEPAAVTATATPRASARPPSPTAQPGAPGLQGLLATAVEKHASDLQLHVGSPPLVRVNGQLEPLDAPVLSASTCEALVQSLLHDDQARVLQERGELDFVYDAGHLGRFRANAYKHHRGLDVCLRHIRGETATLDELGLPHELAKLTTYAQGLVILSGPAGCGKSTTLTTLVHMLNEEREDHILTVEDPVEFVHTSRRALVNQRQVGRDTASFARALRGALREDPDVIVIGELRDLETVSLALTAAETGHLVLATMSTATAIRTVEQLVGYFPPKQQGQVRSMLSESLRGVVVQKLVPRKDGLGRVAAVEVLLVNRAVANLIRDDKALQIHSVMQTGASHGMRLLDESLAALVREGIITQEAARDAADDAARFGGVKT